MSATNPSLTQDLLPDPDVYPESRCLNQRELNTLAARKFRSDMASASELRKNTLDLDATGGGTSSSASNSLMRALASLEDAESKQVAHTVHDQDNPDSLISRLKQDHTLSRRERNIRVARQCHSDMARAYKPRKIMLELAATGDGIPLTMSNHPANTAGTLKHVETEVAAQAAPEVENSISPASSFTQKFSNFPGTDDGMQTAPQPVESSNTSSIVPTGHASSKKSSTTAPSTDLPNANNTKSLPGTPLTSAHLTLPSQPRLLAQPPSTTDPSLLTPSSHAPIRLITLQYIRSSTITPERLDRDASDHGRRGHP